ncbi:MAG: CHAT domain-containing protein [Cyanobacteria bacterium J06632_3]
MAHNTSQNSSINISGNASHTTIISGSNNVVNNNTATQPVEQASNSPTKRKILLLGANPKNKTRLRLDEEIRDIQEGLARSHHRNAFELAQRWAVRPRDFQRAMLEETPQIVHFSGHGEGESGLYFEAENGNAKAVTAAALAISFKLFTTKAPIECVLLNGCYSQVQAEAIVMHVPYVIGMKDAVSDRAAIEFAVGFYDDTVTRLPLTSTQPNDQLILTEITP